MRNIFFLGLISFFADIGSQMVYPVIPLYLTYVFGVSTALVGLIEGIAESAAGLMRVFGGYLSDKFQKKKALAFSGYLGGVFYKLILLVAGSWVGVLTARVVDRTGKGIRVAPRNALVSESACDKSLGRAFGLHKTLDMAGAAIGILIAYFVLREYAGVEQLRRIFVISIIPAVLGLFIFAFIREPKPEKRELITAKSLILGFKTLDKRLRLYLLVVALFTLGSSSNAFLLLKAYEVGYSYSAVILLFFAYHVSASALSLPLGGLSDKVGRKKLLVSGYFVFSAVYLGFALAFSRQLIAAMFILYGAYTAMITGVERAFISEIAPPEFRGTGSAG